MTEIGNLAPDGVPYKIVKADKGKPTYQSGSVSKYDALMVTFEKVRGDNAGERFTKNYTFFVDEASGALSGPGARYLRQAAKAMGIKEIRDTDQLVGQVFMHETVERPNKQGGNPFLDFYPVAVWGKVTAKPQENLLQNGPAAPAAPAVRRQAPK